MKKLYNILNIFVWCIIGVYIGQSIYKYYDYCKYQELYEVQSAPWYTGIITNGISLGIVVAIILIIRALIKKNKMILKGSYE